MKKFIISLATIFFCMLSTSWVSLAQDGDTDTTATGKEGETTTACKAITSSTLPEGGSQTDPTTTLPSGGASSTSH